MSTRIATAMVCGAPTPEPPGRALPGLSTRRHARGRCCCASLPAGHDLLVAYRDGSARYLNYSGKVLLWEARSDAEIEAAITGWLAVGQVIADATGVWDQPSLPPVPPGQARLLMLTPGGHRFGQAPGSAVSRDPTAGPFIAAATCVLQLITSRA